MISNEKHMFFELSSFTSYIQTCIIMQNQTYIIFDVFFIDYNFNNWDSIFPNEHKMQQDLKKWKMFHCNSTELFSVPTVLNYVCWFSKKEDLLYIFNNESSWNWLPYILKIP